MSELNFLALAGGVGGAKLVDGMAQILPPDRLTVIVNTGDDFRHFGLTVSPDLDTVMYTLAGKSNPESGWGRNDESWRTMSEVGQLGGPDWFRLGDLDLATHLVRSQMLFEGCTLTEATQHLCRHFDIRISLLPMSDGPAPTFVVCEDGILPFQTWFVARQWQPALTEIRLPEDVRATPQVVAALENADVVVLAPSNPFVSLEPILNVYPIRAMITDLPELVVAVSPIVAGQAVKGPAAKMMAELGLEVSARAVSRYYGDMVDLFVHDNRDSESPDLPGQMTLRTDTLMVDRANRRRLASEIVEKTVELLHS